MSTSDRGKVIHFTQIHLNSAVVYKDRLHELKAVTEMHYHLLRVLRGLRMLETILPGYTDTEQSGGADVTAPVCKPKT